MGAMTLLTIVVRAAGKLQRPKRSEYRANLTIFAGFVCCILTLYAATLMTVAIACDLCWQPTSVEEAVLGWVQEFNVAVRLQGLIRLTGMLRSVLRSPMRFFDTALMVRQSTRAVLFTTELICKQGSLLNRFGRDIEVIDVDLAPSAGDVLVSWLYSKRC